MADIEAEIVAKGLTAPRVTPADIEANIESWWYFTAADGVQGAAAAGVLYSEQPPVGASSTLRLLTFCVLVLRNGFTVTGESACASPENFNAEIGRRIARENAVAKIWPLMGYALKERLSQGGEPKITAYTAYDVASYETDPQRHMTVFKFKDGTSYALNMDTIDDTDEHVLSIAAHKHTQATGGKKP